jgi:hypothetical protein
MATAITTSGEPGASARQLAVTLLKLPERDETTVAGIDIDNNAPPMLASGCLPHHSLICASSVVAS